MAAEPGSRFAHLLQPIRDLSKIWRIEIADELEKYIEEVGQLVVNNPDAGFCQLNFAEAALLIQGSTAIYSRKVELLYQLVYQALDQIVPDKKDGNGNNRKVGPQTGLWAPIPETDELLTIDHLIKKGRNISLDPSALEDRQAIDVHRRIPLFLLPRDHSDRRKREFSISSCTLHHTGAYLLQESDGHLLDKLLGGAEAAFREEAGPDAPMVPAPPGEAQDLDDRLEELLRDLPDAAGNCTDLAIHANEAAAPFGSAGLELGPDVFAAAADLPDFAAEMGADLDGIAHRVTPLQKDPWALLDEHECLGKEQPLVVGRTSKRAMNARRLQVNADNLPDVSALEPMSDDALWSLGAARALQPSGHPVESLFATVAGILGPGGRYETQRAGFSSAWLEFEDLFVAAAHKRRAFRSTFVPGRGCRGGGARSDDEDGDDVDEAAAAVRATAASLPEDIWGEAPGSEPLPGDFGDGLGDDGRLLQDEQRREVVELETMIEEAQQKYETTIRQHLQKMQQDTLVSDQRKFPELYANVQQWQNQLAPVLKECEARPDFNIQNYGSKFIDRLSNIQCDEGEVVPFSYIADGQPRWEVCRRFLTCLMLTNHGNTDIVFEGEDERLNKFGVRLLNAEQKPLTLDSEDVVHVASPSLPSPLCGVEAPEVRRGRASGRRQRRRIA